MNRQLASLLILPLVLLVVTLIGIIHWATLPRPFPVQPAAVTPVALTLDNPRPDLTIGVVLSLSSPIGEGSDWRYAAEGSRVAALRLAEGGGGPNLIGADDHGTEEGATEAVESLVEQGADAIVAGTTGDHLDGAVDAAQAAGVPLLLPYAGAVELASPDQRLWLTGPTSDQVDETLAFTLSTDQIERPLLIRAGGREPEGLKPVSSIDFDAGQDPETLIDGIDRLGENEVTFDAVVITGPARPQAEVVRALQGTRVSAPIFLTPAATSPAFAANLQELEGSLSSGLTSIGPESGDSASLRPTASGQAMSSYLAAVRMAAADPAAVSVMGDQPFSQVAYAADTPSHDAVVAIATAASVAGSSEPADIASALGSLQLDTTDGLAGPPLDFTADDVMSSRDIGPLAASDEDLGLRPVVDSPPRLIWFAAPVA